MVPPKNNSITTGADGTNEQQLDAMSAANAFLELLPEGAGGGKASTSTNTADPLLSLRVHRPNTTQDALDDEALELMQILRDCVYNASELTGFLAGHPEVIAGHEHDVSMLDATATYLTTLLSHRTYGTVRPTADQARRRNEIRNAHYRAINQFRRIPSEQEEVAGAGVGMVGGGFDGYVQRQEDLSRQVNVRTNPEKRRTDPLVRNLSRVLPVKFQLDGAEEGSGSTEEDKD